MPNVHEREVTGFQAIVALLCASGVGSGCFQLFSKDGSASVSQLVFALAAAAATFFICISFRKLLTVLGIAAIVVSGIYAMLERSNAISAKSKTEEGWLLRKTVGDKHLFLHMTDDAKPLTDDLQGASTFTEARAKAAVKLLEKEGGHWAAVPINRAKAPAFKASSDKDERALDKFLRDFFPEDFK